MIWILADPGALVLYKEIEKMKFELRYLTKIIDIIIKYNFESTTKKQNKLSPNVIFISTLILTSTYDPVVNLEIAMALCVFIIIEKRKYFFLPLE